MSCVIGKQLHHNASATILIGGIPLSSETEFLDRWRPTFEQFLQDTVGQTFSPPLVFQLVPLTQKSVFKAVEKGTVDFLFVNPSLASCLEAEFRTETVATLRNLVVGEETSHFAGVMFTRADNEQVNTIADMRGKVLEASSISIPGAGLLQWQEMRNNHVDMFTDSAQIRFVGDDQSKIVHNVLNNLVDVGFVRSGYIENMVARNQTRWEDLKVIGLKPPHKYLKTQVASTAVVPEWPLVATSSFSRTLRAAVAKALASLQPSHAAALAGGFSSWDLPMSYSSVALSLWEVGVLHSTVNGSRRCMRFDGANEDELYDVVSCPPGHYKRSKTELSTRCAELGLPCPEGFECVCSPCIEADEIMVWASSGAHGSEAPTACKKMEVCTKVAQGALLQVTLADNLRRDSDLAISLELHGTKTERSDAVSTSSEGGYAAVLSSVERGKHLLTVRANAKELPNSPFFIEVVDRDCAGEFGAESFRVADNLGGCVCEQGTIDLRGYCIHVYILLRTLLLQLVCGAVILAASFYVLRGRGASDLRQLSIPRSEVCIGIGEQLHVLGKGQFGMVLKARFRGSDVAVKCMTSDLEWLTGETNSIADSSFGAASKLAADSSFGSAKLTLETQMSVPPRGRKSGLRHLKGRKSVETIDPLVLKQSPSLCPLLKVNSEPLLHCAPPSPLPDSAVRARVRADSMERTGSDPNLKPGKQQASAAHASKPAIDVGEPASGGRDHEAQTETSGSASSSESIADDHLCWQHPDTPQDEPCPLSLDADLCSCAPTASSETIDTDRRGSFDTLNTRLPAPESPPLRATSTEVLTASCAMSGGMRSSPALCPPECIGSSPGKMQRYRGRRDSIGRMMRRLSTVGLESVTGVSSMLSSLAYSHSSSPKSTSMSKESLEQFQKEMRNLIGLRHPCIATLMGIVVDKAGPPLIVMELMEHGSLRGVLSNKSIALEPALMAPMVRDVIQGMAFLHAAKPAVVHGDLKAHNILVDRNFRAKVADFGLSNPQDAQNKLKLKSLTGTPTWMAPELLEADGGHRQPTTETDVYAFGILLWEMATRETPYRKELEEGIEYATIVDEVRRGVRRPEVPEGGVEWMTNMMTRCWDHEPAQRPSFKDLDDEVESLHLTGFHAAAMSSLENFKASLHKSESVLKDVFPPHVVQQLMDGKQVAAERKEEVTIFFSDIVGYTDISSKLEATEVTDMLHRLYKKLDALAKKHHVFKMGIIGDAWMGVTNIESDQADSHASRMARFALDAVEAARQTPVCENDPSMGFVQIRGGFHSGPVVADVVGTTNLQYCLFGDTVNTASRMESTSEAMVIQCSSAAARLVHQQDSNIPLSLRGRIEVKGKGSMSTYFVGNGKPAAEDAGAQGLEFFMNEKKGDVMEGMNFEVASPRLETASCLGKPGAREGRL